MEATIRDGDKIPSRHDLLSVVKKHSNFLGKTLVDEQDAAGIEMDQDFWHNLLNLYFILGRESQGRQDDDLLFFVKQMLLQDRHGTRSNDGSPPYFVRRWGAKLDNLSGETIIEVDWRRSFYLNLIAHTSFTVTVAICSHQVLENHRAGDDKPLAPIYKVVKTVYASPSRINFHLDARKEAETVHAYPDICFAVHDFDSTFDTVVLSDSEHCYCVLLNAHDGAAFPREESEQDCSSASSVPIERVSENSDKNKVTIFSGFVSYQLVREAYDGGRSWFGSLLSPSHNSARTEKLYMRGPRGHGEVEVAVSGIEDRSRQNHIPDMSKKEFGIGMIVQRAAFVATETAKQAYAATSGGTRSSDKEMLPLKCCLMSVSLPWEHIAYDTLFKTGPPVNL